MLLTTCEQVVNLIELAEIFDEPITVSEMEGSGKTKPTLEEVIKYAKPIIYKFIGKYAHDIPKEHKEEIEQSGYLRLVEAYPDLDPDAGWKSYVFNHCRGSVLDYLKFGKGFNEDKWSLVDANEVDCPKLKHRVFLENQDSEIADIDQVLGAAGIFSEIKIDQLHIRWELVAKMASVDEELHAFAKHLKGYKLHEIAAVLGLSRGRVGQMIGEFVGRFDDPALAEDPWFCQTVYAFGLSSRMGMKDRDHSITFGLCIGHDLRPVNLDSSEPFDFLSHTQMCFFDEISGVDG